MKEFVRQCNELQERIRIAKEAGLLITVGEVMKLTGQCRKTIYNYMNVGVYLYVTNGIERLAFKQQIENMRREEMEKC
jgi:hypothetical protein